MLNRIICIHLLLRVGLPKTYIHAYIHTYIHTYMHAYIHPTGSHIYYFGLVDMAQEYDWRKRSEYTYQRLFRAKMDIQCVSSRQQIFKFPAKSGYTIHAYIICACIYTIIYACCIPLYMHDFMSVGKSI
jgi:hypothetical protein